MTTLQAFVLGMMVAWSPSLLLLAWFFYRHPLRRVGRSMSPMEQRDGFLAWLLFPKLVIAVDNGGVAVHYELSCRMNEEIREMIWASLSTIVAAIGCAAIAMVIWLPL